MRIGILGGGQLGRMLVQAASPLDVKIDVMDLDTSFPVPDIWPYFYKGDFTNYDHVFEFGQRLDVITVEIESVNLKALYALERIGKKVFPQPRVLELIADKGTQKEFYTANGLPSAKFLNCTSSDIPRLINEGLISFPFVQKIRKGGYDGKGVFVVKSAEQLNQLLEGPCVVEEMVDIDKELAVIVCRGQDGEIKAYPTVEMQFHPTANLVEFLFSPSKISEEKQKEAEKIAIEIADKMGIVGLLAVEFFLDKSGNILINEVAPRPHNSGHQTIEANITSQYEQHLRALMGWPLGDTHQIQPAAMINLLGAEGYAGEVIYEGLREILGISNVFPHLYGKKLTKPYRKMGHVTILGTTLDEVISKTEKVKAIIKVKA